VWLIILPEWKYGGYNEIQDPPLRYRIIHREMLVRLLGHDNETQMKEAHRSWVDVLVEKRAYSRNPVWTESIIKLHIKYSIK
jgi:putative transposase